MTVDLNTCVPGQLCVSEDGVYFTYLNKLDNNCRYHHLLLDEERRNFTFTNDGIYDINYPNTQCNIVCILPMESITSDKHPSIAWWESCPWITDRAPTGKDSDSLGQVVMQVKSEEKTRKMPNLCFIEWEYVRSNQAWIHTLSWQSPALTDKEQAMELINNHEDSWIPTPKQWHIIRKGLEN